MPIHIKQGNSDDKGILPWIKGTIVETHDVVSFFFMGGARIVEGKGQGDERG